MPNICLEVKKFPERTEFLHRVLADAMEKKDAFAFLNPKDSRTNRSPITYSHFAIFIPSIMHHVEKALLADHLCNDLLTPTEFSGPALNFPTLYIPAANEDEDYQRLKFLDDSILKMLISIALMADHLIRHEGYNSRAKGHVVTNGRLATATYEMTLVNTYRPNHLPGRNGSLSAIPDSKTLRQ